MEQVASSRLLDESIQRFVNNVFEVGEGKINRVSKRRSLKLTAEPDNHVPETPAQLDECSGYRSNVSRLSHVQLWWFVLPLALRLRRSEHIEFFKKVEAEVA